MSKLSAEEREAELERRFQALGVRAEDIEESFTRSSGPGGQHVNKTSSAVILLHRPSGVRVRCESERSQAVNRRRARELLLEKLEHQKEESAAAQRSQAEKVRRQKRKRPPRVKARILQDKSRRAETKKLRRRVERD